MKTTVNFSYRNIEFSVVKNERHYYTPYCIIAKYHGKVCYYPTYDSTLFDYTSDEDLEEHREMVMNNRRECHNYIKVAYERGDYDGGNY